jgi:hypothetical protein
MTAVRAARIFGMLASGVMCLVAIVLALGRVGAVEFGSHEAYTSYDISRSNRGLSSAIDPMHPAFDDGIVPIVSKVTYTPVWTLILRAFEHPLEVGQGISLACWLGSYLALIIAARSENRTRTLIFAASFANAFLLRCTTVAGPDTLAAMLAAAALTVALRAGKVSFLSLALAEFAAFARPNVIGVFVGLIIVHFLTSSTKKQTWLTLLFAGTLGSVVLAGFEYLGHGNWFKALRITTQNALSAQRLLAFSLDYAWFLALPLLVVAAYLWCRKGPDRLFVIPIVTSTLWHWVASGRFGSATNYWLEPTLATTALLAFHREVQCHNLPLRTNMRNDWLEHGQKLWRVLPFAGYPIFVAAISLGPWRELGTRHPTNFRNQLRELRDLCPDDATGSWISSNAPLEFKGTGRIAMGDFGMAFAIRRGSLGMSVLDPLLRNDRVRCYVHSRDLRIPPPPSMGQARYHSSTMSWHRSSSPNFLTSSRRHQDSGFIEDSRAAGDCRKNWKRCLD